MILPFFKLYRIEIAVTIWLIPSSKWNTVPSLSMLEAVLARSIESSPTCTSHHPIRAGTRSEHDRSADEPDGSHSTGFLHTWLVMMLVMRIGPRVGAAVWP
ncbi:hypothetical protein N7526_011411 [Penicillium atrosanguineum]|nr:hypothetical protein N7526_011411 [Penicillium atrosanguineum]